MAHSINLMERYLLENYDTTSQTGIGTKGVVDPHEKEAFLTDISADASFSRPRFEAWKAKAVFKAPYLSNLQFEQFKAELLGSASNTVTMNIGDDKVSAQFNSKATVIAARVRDIPREGRAFIPMNPSSEVTFTIDLDSVNAFRESPQIRSFSRVYIVPKGYKGKVPPQPQEMARWYAKARSNGYPKPMESYFFEIIPGKTEAKSSKIFDSGRGDFSYVIKMPPGSYEVHGVSGEFEQANGQKDFDNFLIKITGQNAVAETEVLHAAIAARIEVEDEAQRRFIEQVANTAEVLGDDGSLKGKKIDIIFAIDNSGSMEPGAALVKDTVADIVGALKRIGADGVRVGVITFNNPDSIITIMPLTEMDDKGIRKLHDIIAGIRFEGGLEPVGKATLRAIEALKDSKGNSCQVMVITDYDGLNDDNRSFYGGYGSKADTLYGEKVVEAALDTKVAVNLQEINPGQPDFYKVLADTIANSTDLTESQKASRLREIEERFKSSSFPIVEIVPAEYISLFNEPIEQGDEAKIKTARELAYGEKNKSERVRSEARRVLAAVGTKEDLDRLSAEPQKLEPVLIELLIARGAISGDAIFNIAKGANNAASSTTAAKGLIAMEGDTAMIRLTEVLRDQSVKLYNRYGIAYALALNGSKEALKLLADITMSDPDNIGSKTLELFISGGESSKDLLKSVAMSKADVSLRRKACVALEKNDHEEAVKAAQTIFISSPRSLETVEFVLSIDKEKGTAFLRGLLDDTNIAREDRIMLSKTLAKRGDDSSIDFLCSEAKVMTDPKEVLNILVSIGGKGLDAVRNIAVDAYAGQTRVDAAEALVSADKDAAKTAVLQMIENPEGREYFNRPAVRFKLLYLLLVLDQAEALTILKKELKAGDTGRQFEAAKLIYPYDAKVARAVLTRLAKNPDFASSVRVFLTEQEKKK